MPIYKRTYIDKKEAQAFVDKMMKYEPHQYNSDFNDYAFVDYTKGENGKDFVINGLKVTSHTKVNTMNAGVFNVEKRGKKFEIFYYNNKFSKIVYFVKEDV